MRINDTIKICIAALLSCSCSGNKGDVAAIEAGEPTESIVVIHATGRLQPSAQVDISSRVPGVVSKLYADFNDEVDTDMPLAEIEKVVLQADYRSADAVLAAARANLEYTRTNYDRDKALYEKDLISAYEYQTSRKEFEMARHELERASAEMSRSAENLRSAKVYSPLKGVVLRRHVQPGQSVDGAADKLFTIANIDSMIILAQVAEADIAEVKEGQHVRFAVEAYPDSIFNGRVEQVRIGGTTDSNATEYEVVVSTPNPGRHLYPGMSAELDIIISEAVRSTKADSVPNVSAAE